MQWSSERNRSLADSIGGALEEKYGKSLPPLLKGRIERLRWLYDYIDQKDLGVSSSDIRNALMSKFGLTARTATEYIEQLAGQNFIMIKAGVWVTLRNSLPQG